MPIKTIPAKLMTRFLETMWIMARSNPLKACVSMTLGLCFHFLGYECARAASITLLAAKHVGLGNEAIPLTIALGSPLSGLVLYLYTKSIKKFGSKLTLRISFVAVIFVLSVITFYGRSLKGLPGKVAIVAFYAFREIYVSLLSSQQWAFIAGTLNKGTSSYIVMFSGVVSVASAVGGCSIEQLVNLGGVQALLLTALLASVASCLCAEFAYTLSDVLPSPAQASAHHVTTTTTTATTAPTAIGNNNNNCESSHGNEKISPRMQNEVASATAEATHTGARKRLNSSSAHATTNSHTHTGSTVVAKKTGFWSDSWNLIWKHKMLQVLFIEGLLHQLCGNMLNLMFHNGLRLEVADDATRAMLVGRFFATVNITSCTLQCFVLPYVLSHSTLPSVLSRIPLFVLAAALYGVVQPGLISVMLGFGTIKVLEYSVMHSASEMIYMPLGHEVRYLGKELVRFFGHKLGKSGSSLVLSALVSQFQPSLAVQSMGGAALTMCWGAAMLVLANTVRERDHEDELALQRANNSNANHHHTASSSQHKHHHHITASTAEEIKTRRKARSFSLDDSAISLRTNSRATHRVATHTDPTGAVLRHPDHRAQNGNNNSNNITSSSGGSNNAAAVGNKSSVVSKRSTSSDRSSDIAAAPIRALSASREPGAVAYTSSPVTLRRAHQQGQSRSVSLDQSRATSASMHDRWQLQRPQGQPETTDEEEIPVHPVYAATSVGALAAASDGVGTPSEKAFASGDPEPTATATGTSPTQQLHTVAECDGLDTMTDASGSPEVSVCFSQSARSHAESVDSIASLNADFDRAGSGSFSEGIPGMEEDEEGENAFGQFRPSHSSVDSLGSLASRERRLSWENDQRRRERASVLRHRQEQDDAPPVMLRVGSVSVSLSTLNARAERRRQGRETP